MDNNDALAMYLMNRQAQMPHNTSPMGSLASGFANGYGMGGMGMTNGPGIWEQIGRFFSGQNQRAEKAAPTPEKWAMAGTTVDQPPPAAPMTNMPVSAPAPTAPPMRMAPPPPPMPSRGENAPNMPMTFMPSGGERGASYDQNMAARLRFDELMKNKLDDPFFANSYRNSAGDY